MARERFGTLAGTGIAAYRTKGEYQSMDQKEHIIEGRKTFFITPNTTLFPESFLYDYLGAGYETYFIMHDKGCTIEHKVECIIKTFPNSILFFSIDTTVMDVQWSTLIRKVFAAHQNEARIGVMYTHRQSEKDRNDILQLYERTIGLQCKCIQLEYKKDLNYNVVLQALVKNDAMGRRKQVRAICGAGSSMSFDHKGSHYGGRISDVSMSHFSCIITGELPLPNGLKLNDIQINLRGMHLRSGGTLIMQRETPGGMLYVFMFTDSATGKPGLDVFSGQLLLPKIYEIMKGNCDALLSELYYRRK